MCILKSTGCEYKEEYRGVGKSAVGIVYCILKSTGCGYKEEYRVCWEKCSRYCILYREEGRVCKVLKPPR